MRSHTAPVRSGTTKKCIQHRTAVIDSVDLDIGISFEQLRCEPAVAVAEDQGSLAGTRQVEVDTTAFPKQIAEGDFFHPEVGSGEAIEVWWWLHRMQSTSGVRRTRSAAVRSETGRRCSRFLSRATMRKALREHSASMAAANTLPEKRNTKARSNAARARVQPLAVIAEPAPDSQPSMA